MKTFISLILLVAFTAFAAPAFAVDVVNKVPFANISAASAAVKTSSVLNVTGYKTKTLHVSGVTLPSSPTSITFKNMSGTLVAQCGPTSSGPWTTCIANDYGQTAVSRTTNGVFTWSDVTNYIRLQWTSGTVGGKLKAWLSYIE